MVAERRMHRATGPGFGVQAGGRLVVVVQDVRAPAVPSSPCPPPRSASAQVTSPRPVSGVRCPVSGVWCLVSSVRHPCIPRSRPRCPHGVEFVERVGAAGSVHASTVGVPVSGLWVSGVRVLCPRISCPPCPRRVGSWSVGAAGSASRLRRPASAWSPGGVRKRPGCLPELPWWSWRSTGRGVGCGAGRRLGTRSAAAGSRFHGLADQDSRLRPRVTRRVVGSREGSGCARGRHMLDGGAPVVVVSEARIAGVKP